MHDAVLVAGKTSTGLCVPEGYTLRQTPDILYSLVTSFVSWSRFFHHNYVYYGVAGLKVACLQEMTEAYQSVCILYASLSCLFMYGSL